MTHKPNNPTDPNKPSCSIPWCRECRDHTDWITRVHTGRYTHYLKHCKNCDSIMMSPNKSLLFCLGLAAFTVMCVWASYATIAKSSGEEPDWAGILFGILFFWARLNYNRTIHYRLVLYHLFQVAQVALGTTTGRSEKVTTK